MSSDLDDMRLSELIDIYVSLKIAENQGASTGEEANFGNVSALEIRYDNISVALSKVSGAIDRKYGSGF